MTVLGSLFRYEVHRVKLMRRLAAAARDSRPRVSAESCHNSSRRSLLGLTPRNHNYETSRPGELPCFGARGLGFEKAQGANR